MVVTMDGVPRIRYMGQHDISVLLGKDRHTVNVWRSRYPDFPEQDADVGLHAKSVPLWLPERIDEIRAWAKGRGLIK